MASTTTTSSPGTTPTPKRFRWLRRLGWLAGVLIVLLLIVYFVGTSSAFFKGVILPRVGKAMNAEVTANDASISPFSAVTLRGFTVKTTGAEPVVSVDEVRLRYSLMSILRGNIQVDEVTVAGPKIRIEQRADGTSNLDPLTKGSEKKPANEPTKPSGPSEPLQVAIAKIAMTDGSVHILQKDASGGETRIELDKLNFTLSDLRNGQTAQTTFEGTARWQQQAGGSNSSIAAPMKMDLRIGLTPSLGLATAQGGFTVTFQEALGAAALLAGANIKIDCEITPNEVKALAMRATKGGQTLGEFSVHGPFDAAKYEGSLSLILTNLNLADWRAFAPDLDPTGRVHASGQLAARQAGKQVDFDLALGLEQVAARFGDLRLPAQNHSLFAAGGVTNFNQVTLRRAGVTLVETPRTKANRVELTGNLDLSQTDAIAGALHMTADTLDITPYYDIIDKPAAPASTGPAGKTPPSTPSTNAPAEPDPIRLPVRQLTMDAKVGKFWLREVEATNFQAAVKIEPSHVTVRPLTLVMNGGLLDSDIDLDLSVRGWRYVIAFNAAGLPIQPLADSFVPDYRGRAKGDLFAQAKIEGTGVTGPSLRKNLAANVGFSFTNADIQIVGPRLRGFLTPIAAALNAPGLLESPIKSVAFDAGANGGKLNLSQLAFVSSLFSAATHGELSLADKLSASQLTKWPMKFQLERSLAERAKVAPKDTPATANLVALPDFIQVAGTVNEPKPQLDLKALAGAALMKYVDKIPGVDEKTGNLLKGMGGMLTGSKTNTTGTSTNAAPATNNLPSRLRDLLKRP